jgi:hypothetical protein
MVDVRSGRGRFRRPLVIAVAATVAVLVPGVVPGRTASAASPAAPGWTTLWTDDFTGSGRLSADWIYRIGTQIPGGPPQFGTGEVEYNTDSVANVDQRGGYLHITALRDATGAWTSGRVETSRDDFQPPPGGVLAVEARMQLPDVTGPAAAGYWPAFWMLGAPYRGNLWNWPGVGEIDIMENVQGLNTEWGTLHCGTSPGGECNEKDGLSANTPGGSPTLQAGIVGREHLTPADPLVPRRAPVPFGQPGSGVGRHVGRGLRPRLLPDSERRDRWRVPREDGRRPDGGHRVRWGIGRRLRLGPVPVRRQRRNAVPHPHAGSLADRRWCSSAVRDPGRVLLRAVRRRRRAHHR